MCAVYVRNIYRNPVPIPVDWKGARMSTGGGSVIRSCLASFRVTYSVHLLKEAYVVHVRSCNVRTCTCFQQLAGVGRS